MTTFVWPFSSSSMILEKVLKRSSLSLNSPSNFSAEKPCTKSNRKLSVRSCLIANLMALTISSTSSFAPRTSIFHFLFLKSMDQLPFLVSVCTATSEVGGGVIKSKLLRVYPTGIFFLNSSFESKGTNFSSQLCTTAYISIPVSYTAMTRNSF